MNKIQVSSDIKTGHWHFQTKYLGCKFFIKLVLNMTKQNQNWNSYNDSKLFSSTKLDLLV